MDPNITPYGEQTDAQGQAVTPPPPGAQQAPTPAASLLQGPFSGYLDPSQTREPTHVASQQRPSGYMGAGGKMAMILDQFLGGLAKSRATAYNRSIQEQAAQRNRIAQQIKSISENPTLSEADQMAALKPLLQAQASFGMHAIQPGEQAGEKKGGKKGKEQDHPNPIVNFMGQAFRTIAGPGAQPQPITPQTVDQAIGASYSVVSNAVGKQQQQSAAVSEAYAAMKGRPLQEALKDASFQAAVQKFAAAGGDREKFMTGLEKAEQGQRVKTTYNAVLKDGSKVAVNELGNGTYVKASDGSPFTEEWTSLERLGTGTAPKLTPEEQKAADWGKTIVANLGIDGIHNLSEKDKGAVAILPHIDDKQRGLFFNHLRKNPNGPNPVDKALDVALSTTSTEVSEADRTKKIQQKKDLLQIQEEELRIQKLQQDLKGNKPLKKQELEHQAVLALQGVHAMPGTEADFQKDLGVMRSPIQGSHAADDVAAKMRDRAIANIKDTNNYREWSPEHRGQVLEYLTTMPLATVRKVFGVAAPTAGQPPAGGAPRTPPPPGAEKPAPKSAAAPGAKGPPPKVLGTKDEARKKAKALGVSDSRMDAFLAWAEAQGHIK